MFFTSTLKSRLKWMGKPKNKREYLFGFICSRRNQENEVLACLFAWPFMRLCFVHSIKNSRRNMLNLFCWKAPRKRSANLIWFHAIQLFEAKKIWFPFSTGFWWIGYHNKHVRSDQRTMHGTSPTANWSVLFFHWKSCLISYHFHTRQVHYWQSKIMIKLNWFNLIKACCFHYNNDYGMHSKLVWSRIFLTFQFCFKKVYIKQRRRYSI